MATEPGPGPGQHIGVIGLGAMGGPMARNLAAAGHPLLVFDAAGTRERAPPGARCAADVAAVVGGAGIVLLSLPDIAAVRQVVAAIADAAPAPGMLVVDTSTVGPDEARAAHARLAPLGVEYLDAPVSGQAFRAVEGTLTLMVSASDAAFERLRPLLGAIGSNVFHVGREPGQGQLMKIINNYLSISSFVTTSEAVAYGVRRGLDMATILDVVNASTGQNFTTSQVFPRNVLPGTYDMHAATPILTKDLGLFVEAAARDGASCHVARSALEVVRAFVAACPDGDQSEIYRFVRAGGIDAGGEPPAG